LTRTSRISQHHAALIFTAITLALTVVIGTLRLQSGMLLKF